MGGDNRGSANPVSLWTDDHLDKPFGLAVEYSSVHISQFLPEGAEPDPALCCFVVVEADVSDLRVGVGTPGNGQGAGFCPPFEQGLLDVDAPHGVGGLPALETRADLAGATAVL